MPVTTIATNLAISTTGTSPTVTIPSGLSDSYVSVTMVCPINGSFVFVCESSPDGTVWTTFHNGQSDTLIVETLTIGTMLNQSVGMKARFRVTAISGIHTVTSATVTN